MAIIIDGDGTITGLDADGISAQPVFPGNVIQVVQATYSTEVNISSTSYTDTGLSASITPTSATSKILIIVSQIAFVSRESTSTVRGDAQIVRNSTSVFEQFGFTGGRADLSSNGDILYFGVFSGVYLDSPNTTSATTYKTQGKLNSTANSSLLRFQENATSTIILMEIAA